MGLLGKIFTAVRGGAREVGETIVDNQSTRIFEQEIHDAEEHLNQAKQDLTGVMAKEMQASREIERLQQEIKKHEDFALQALDKKDENLALEISQRIAGFTSELDVQQKAKEQFATQGQHLKDLIMKTDSALAEMNRQLTLVKATDSVQKATSAITENFSSSNSKLLEAKESLDRIKQHQQDVEDRQKAGETLQGELSGQDLDDKLKAAGIGQTENSAQDILAKLKERKGNV